MRLLEDTPLDTTAELDAHLSSGMRRTVEGILALLEAEWARDADKPSNDRARIQRPPILVAGDWGSGKTSLLRLVQRRLEHQEDAIWFDAWRYEASEELLVALLRRIWDAASLRRKLPLAMWEGLKSTARRAVPALARLGVEALLASTAGPLAVIATMAARAAGVASAAPLANTAGKTAGRVVEASQSGVDDALPDRAAIDELRARFRDLLAKGWPNSQPVVFIDDLDRCTPEGAINLLDALRALVVADDGSRLRGDRGSDTPDEHLPLPCQFVVALDREIIVAAIGKKFAGLDVYDGNRYLEKVFPFTFHVPTLTEEEAKLLLHELIKRLPGATAEADRPQRLPPLSKAAVLQILSKAIFANPRLMIRCLNRYVVLRHVATPRSDGWPSTAADQEALLGWIAAGERWPALRRLVQQRQVGALRELAPVSAIEASLTDAARAQAASDPELLALQREKGALPWLRDAAAAEDGLQRFARAEELLRSCGL